MATSVPTRITAAVERLAVRPGDQMLEIACGHGAAAALVCARLDQGRALAIDRPEKQIRLASKRNSAHKSD